MNWPQRCAAAISLTIATIAFSVPAHAAATTSLGVYEGAANPSGVVSFGNWLGVQPTQALDFIPRAVNQAPVWDKVDNPTFWTSAWESQGFQMVYSLPLLIEGTTFNRAIDGEFDSHFENFASNLVAHGQGDAYVRLGWEFNGDWYPWKAEGHVQKYIDAFRHVSQVLTNTAPNLRIVWCRTRGGFDKDDPGKAYPGNAYVDVISLDSYDNKPISDPVARWQAEKAEMAPFAAFAANHPGKIFGVDEWGLQTSDSVKFIDGMANWFAQNGVDYQSYFNQDDDDKLHELVTHFPNATAEYKLKFGP